MLRLTTRQLRAHKVRFALTGLAVVLGVAFMTGTTILSDTMGRTFDDLLASANAEVDVVVQRPEVVDAEWGEARSRVPAATVEAVAAVDGVAVAAGSVTAPTQLVRADGTVADPDGFGGTIGASWLPEALNPFDLASGHAPGADEAVVDEATVEGQGWSLGDTVTVLSHQGPQDLVLVGTATMGGASGLPGTSLVATDDATAQSLFGQPGQYDAVVATAADGTDPDALAAAVGEAVGTDGFEVLTGAADTAAQQDRMAEDLAFFDQFLMAFAFISLFVGVFIIANTFSIVMAQRRRDLALLRAIGATRRQVLTSLVVESAAVGVAASVTGLAGGVGMAVALRALLGAVGLEIPAGDLVVSTGAVVTALVVGVAVTVLSALVPALRASRVPPLAALRDVAADRAGASPARVVGGVVLTGTGVAAFAAGAAGEGADAAQLLGLGALVVVLGVVVLGPVLARPAMVALGWPAPRISGAVGRIARENARRNPRRTSATATALMVGVALVGFITILASSTQGAVGNAVDRTLRADLVVESGAWDEGGFTPALADELAALPGVTAASGLRSAPASVDGRGTELDAVEAAAIDDLVDLGVVEGSLAAVDAGGIAVRSTAADEHGLAVGDEVEVVTADGSARLPVAAVFTDPLVGTADGTYLVDLSTYGSLVADQLDRRVYLAAGDGADVAAVREAVATTVAGYPNAEVQDQAEVKAAITDEIGQILNLVYGLLALAVVIALLGIANTLGLSVHERTRELGLLRAVGMTRRQLRTSVRWESVLIALLGTVLGAGLAVGGACGVVQTLGTEGVTTLVVPPGQLATIVALAALAGVVAAVGPARRAARANVLAAIAS